MPKLISSGSYQCKEYTLDDYIRYVFLVDHMSPSSINALEMQNKAKSSVTYLDYIKRLKLLNQQNGWLVSMTYIETIIAALENNNIDSHRYFTELNDVIAMFPKTTNETFNAEFKDILDSLFRTLHDIHSIDIGQWEVRDPAEASPRTKSLEYWHAAWARVVPDTGSYDSNWVGRVQVTSGHLSVIDEIKEEGRRNNVNESIVNAHITNLKMILNPNYHALCIQEFSPRSMNTSSRQNTGHDRSHPGFLLGVYQNPLFQHWLVRAILLALILSAALVAAAFMVKVAVLPVAVAGFVTGLSQLAAYRIFGAAVTVGVAATATLVASIHASFFSAELRNNGGGASSAGHSTGYQC